MGGSEERGRLGGGPAPPARLGRVRTTRSKLEELPTVLERTQEKEQRVDEALHHTECMFGREHCGGSMRIDAEEEVLTFIAETRRLKSK